MKFRDWKETAELIGIFAILISLIFVAVQLRQEEELIQLEVRNHMIETYAELNATIIEHADVWLRGNAGDELDAAEREIHKRLVVNYNDWHFHTALIFGEIEPEAVEHVLTDYAGFLARNPGAYRVWRQREDEINADRTTMNPAETITADWIDTLESRIKKIRAAASPEE